MPHTFSIALSAGKQPALTFPPQCVCCGKPQACESTLRIDRLVMRGQRQTPLRLRYQVPHCNRCARSTRAVFLAGCIPFVLGGLLIGGAAFAWVALGASALGFDEVGRPVNANSLVLGAAAGLVVGILGGFVCEVIVRLLLLPFFGRALLQAPLLAHQLLQDADHVAGLTATLDAQASRLQLTFVNDAVADAFAAANPGVPGLNS
jgi:hypothetical protein